MNRGNNTGYDRMMRTKQRDAFLDDISNKENEKNSMNLGGAGKVSPNTVINGINCLKSDQFLDGFDVIGTTTTKLKSKDSVLQSNLKRYEESKSENEELEMIEGLQPLNNMMDRYNSKYLIVKDSLKLCSLFSSPIANLRPSS